MNTQYYQLILDNISDIAWFIDKDGKFVVVNNAFLDLYKIKKSDILGKTYFDILDTSTADKYNKQNLSVISTRQQLVHETYVELENEGWLEFKWYETILSPAIDPTTHDCVGIVGLGRDISERKQKLQKLREQQEWLKVYFELPIIGMAIITESSQWLNVNEKFCHTLGYSYQELMNTKLVDLISGTSKDEFTQALHGLSQSNLDHVDLELALYRRSGDTVYVHLMIHVIHKVDEEQNQFVIMMEDVTEKRQIEQKLHLANRVIDSSSEAIMITDHRSEIVRVNEAFTTLTGYEEKEVLGRNPRLLQSGRNTKEFYQKMWDSITSTGSWQGEMWDRRKDGSTYPKWMNISSIVRPETQKVSHYVALFSDMTERKRAENKIRYMVYHDTLTGLPNRTLLEERLIRAISDAEVELNKIALIQIDLDNFKTINDSMGHYVGDQLLKAVASRLQNTFRNTDLIARLGGDEFLVVIDKLSDISSVKTLANNVLDAFKRPFNVLNYTMHVSPSVGISSYPDDGENHETLLKNVDTAMHNAKQRGRNQYVFFNKDMSASLLKRIKLEYSLRTALEKNQFQLVYQPQVELRSNTVVGVEALIRWKKDDSYVSPVDFIPIAEETGLIIPIGEWTLEQACSDCKHISELGFPINMAVNLSASQFLKEYLTDLVKSTLAKTQLPASQLDLEITEGMLMNNADGAIQIINELKKLGIKISIDDFGTGYSSLAYLKAFNIDKLKIDRSFVTGLPDDKDDIAITSAIIQLAKSMELKIVAEGAEEIKQVDYLGLQDCDQIQGYYFAKPMARDDLINFLQNWNVRH